MDRHNRGDRDICQPFPGSRVQRYHISDTRHNVAGMRNSHRVCDFPTCLRVGPAFNQEILARSRRPAYQHRSSPLSADGFSLFGVSGFSNNGPGEPSTNDFHKVSIRRTPYSGVDELEHTHVRCRVGFCPRVLVL